MNSRTIKITKDLKIMMKALTLVGWEWQVPWPTHALVQAEARAPALLARAPDTLVRADARAPALLASAPDALVLADARAPALLAPAPSALVRADARAPALLACAPLPLVRAETAWLLPRGASRCTVLFAPPLLAGAASRRRLWRRTAPSCTRSLGRHERNRL